MADWKKKNNHFFPLVPHFALSCKRERELTANVSLSLTNTHQPTYTQTHFPPNLYLDTRHVEVKKQYRLIKLFVKSDVKPA